MGGLRVPSIDYQAFAGWKNYHASITLDVAEHGVFRRGGGAPASGPEMFAASAAVLHHHIARAVRADVPAGVLGATWSWSALTGTPELQLATGELDAIFPLEAGDLAPGARLDPAACVYVGGGARLDALVAWAEARGLSIKTCGSYLGQSLAGAIATSVNGSALGYGGFQNQVLGLHLLVGESESVWIERAGVPVLSDAAAARFAGRVIRDDAIFADALVHLGGMGLVNGVVFGLVPKHRFTAVRIKRAVDAGWAEALAGGDFAGVARMLGVPGEPVYYEVQLNPFAPYVTPALHTFYFRLDDAGGAAALAASAAPEPLPTVFAGVASALAGPQALAGGAPEIPPDLFAYYAAYKFIELPPPGPGEPMPTWSWGELHAAQPDPQTRQLIYSAALAIKRERLPEALAAMSAAVVNGLAQLPPPQQLRHLIWTLRFVDDADGTMAFTRFARSVVVDLEGIVLSPLSLWAADRSCTGLGDGGIDYCMHWGKFMPGTDWIARQFGTGPDAPLVRWRKTRRELMGELADTRVFTNPALVKWQIL
jgi:FAD/FMN-containing dehydrogenase